MSEKKKPEKDNLDQQTACKELVHRSKYTTDLLELYKDWIVAFKGAQSIKMS